MLSESFDFSHIKVKNWHILILLMVAYMLLSFQYIETEDDTMYSYLHEGLRSNLHVWNHPIKSFSDILKSQYADYHHWNGRVIIHGVVQFICGYKFGNTLFAILSSLVFGLMLLGTRMLVKLLSGASIGYLTILFAFVTLVPGIGQTLLGNVSFVANYMWVSTATIWCICFILRYTVDKSTKTLHLNAITTIFFLICGCLHEGFAIPMSCFLFCWILIQRKNINKTFLIYSIAFLCGTMFVALAPANFERMAEVRSYIPESTLLSQLKSNAKMLISDSALPVTLLILLTAYVAHLHGIRHTLKSILPLLIIIGFIFLFDLCVAYLGQHQLTPASILMVIAMLVLISNAGLELSNKPAKIIMALIAGLLTIGYAYIFYARNVVYNEYNAFKDHIVNTDGNTVIADNLFTINKRFPQSILDFTQMNVINRLMAHRSIGMTLISVWATEGKTPYKVENILPAAPDTLLTNARPSELNNQILTTDDLIIIKSQIGQQPEKLEIVKKSSRLRSALIKRGLRQESATTIRTNTLNYFDKDGFRYSILYLSPKVITSIKLS